jgi:serine/threonine protein kinase
MLPANFSTILGVGLAPGSSLPGTRIGQYEVIRLLGRGGMGEVHLARDLRLGRLVRPVEASDHRFEPPALVDRMIADLAATPGALPLLQFTAAPLWERRDRDRRRLTEASYEEIGVVAGALARHADAVLAGMSQAQQAVARAVLQRLVSPERTRSLVNVAELHALHADREPVDGVVSTWRRCGWS